MKKIDELKKQQDQIEKEIEKLAKASGLIKDDLLPVYDGVYSIDDYLESNPKVMWILKEPWGNVEEGHICGGGNYIFDDLEEDPEKIGKIKSWQMIIYTMYGYLNGCKWKDMENIYDDIDMINVLKQIAYVNVSKMPGYSRSLDKNIRQSYFNWKTILHKQIKIYDPDVIVFGGTYSLFEKDWARGAKYQGYIKDAVYWYELEDKKLIEAYHPNARVKKELYVDSIIQLLNEWYPRNH